MLFIKSLCWSSKIMFPKWSKQGKHWETISKYLYSELVDNFLIPMALTTQKFHSLSHWTKITVCFIMFPEVLYVNIEVAGYFTVFVLF